jgi:hypothetical protein
MINFFVAAVAVASACAMVKGNCLDEQIDGATRDTKMVVCCEPDTSKTIPSAIGDLQGLERILLQRCSLTGTVPRSMTGLRNARNIFLYENKLEGEVNPRFGDMPSLEKLMLSKNQFTGTIPAALAYSDNLKKITLHSNLLVGTIPQAFERMEKLFWFTLSENRIQQPMIELPTATKYYDFTSKELYIQPGGSCAENPERCLREGTCSDKAVCCEEGEVCAKYQYFWYEDVPAETEDESSVYMIGIAVAGAGAVVVAAALVAQRRRRSVRTVPNKRDSETSALGLSKKKSMVAANPAFKEVV